MIQAEPEALSLAPLGWAIASPMPRAAVVVPMAIQGSLRSASRLWLASAASTSVTGSSMMKMGCTRAIGPVASAAAWATAATMTMPMPASQTRRLTRSAMSDTCMDRSFGTWAAARRCSTDAHALLAAVSSAKNTQTTVCAAIGWMCTWIPASVSPAFSPFTAGSRGRRGRSPGAGRRTGAGWPGSHRASPARPTPA